jgi:2'-5' RNA ligase
VRNMPEQLCFPGLEPRSSQDRLFFALLLPPSSAAAITRAADGLRNGCGLKGRPIERGRLHVSLHAVGQYDGLPNFIVGRAHRAGAMVSTSPFPLVFDRVVSFGNKQGKRPLVLRPGYDLAPLFTLHSVLGEAMKRAGIGRHIGPHFTPHMTLLYDSRVVRERPIEPIRMNVRDFVLVHSIVGQRRYIELARWPLRG